MLKRLYYKILNKNISNLETKNTIISIISKISDYRLKVVTLDLYLDTLNSIDILYIRFIIIKRYNFILKLFEFLLARNIRSLVKLIKNIALFQEFSTKVVVLIVLGDYLSIIDS